MLRLHTLRAYQFRRNSLFFNNLSNLACNELANDSRY